MSVNYGSKRIVVGAHYGLRDWLAQRVTGLLMALFTAVVLAQVLFSKGPMGYDKWAGIFSTQWMKTLTFSIIIAMLYHAWWACAKFSWTTSSLSTYALHCKYFPLSGSWAVRAGPSRSCGAFDPVELLRLIS